MNKPLPLGLNREDRDLSKYHTSAPTLPRKMHGNQWSARPGTSVPPANNTLSRRAQNASQLEMQTATPPKVRQSQSLRLWQLGSSTIRALSHVRRPPPDTTRIRHVIPAPPTPLLPYPRRLETQILKVLAQREPLKRSQINMHVKLISFIS